MADMKLRWLTRNPSSSPANTAAPIMSGSGLIGDSLSVSDGTWDIAPDGFEYRWKRDGVVIDDASSNVYGPVPADDQTDVTAEVRAQKNGRWSGWAASNAFSITYPAPVLTDVRIVPPFGDQGTVFGYEFDGDVPGAALTQQWQMNNSNISGATGTTHQPTSDGSLTMELTATNSGGSHTLESQAVAIVSADIFGVTQGGTNVNTGNYPAPFPAYGSGDLVLLVAGIEAQGKTLSFPAQTPSGEAIFPITANHNVAGSDITLSAVGWIGSGSRPSGTIDVVVTGGPDQFATAAIHFPAGTFDADSPIDAIALGGTGTAATSSNTSAFSVTNASATIIRVVMADGTAPSGIGAGYHANNIWTPGAVAAMVASRNTLTSAAESVAAVAVNFPVAEVWSGISFAINADGSPTLTRVPDCTILPVASVASGTFGAVGNPITVTAGTWIGSPTTTQYQWLRNGVAISGETSNSYTPVSGDAGTVIVPQVRRQNTVGFSGWVSASNSATIVASAAAPIIAVLPAQSHLEDTGIQTLDVSAYTTGDAPITYSRSPTSSAVTIDSSTGVLSINTTNPIAQTTFTITATNAAGSANRDVSVQVSAPATSGFFVATTGSDTTGDGTIGNPWRTIAFAAAQLDPGDTLNIRAGTYGGFVCPVSGTSAAPITIQGYPGERPLLDGRIAAGSRGTIHISAKDWLVFKNMDVIEGQPDCVYVEGVAGQLHGNILFEDVYAAHCNNSAFYICGLQMGGTIPLDTWRTQNITIRNCEIEDTNRTAPPGNECISAGGGLQHFIVEDCWIHDSNRYGVDLKLGCRRAIIRRNVIHNMTNHGIYLDAASRLLEDVYVYANVVFDCGANGITIAREAARDPGSQDIRDVWVWNNVFARNSRGILVYKHVNDTLVGDFDNVKVFNNTFVDSDGAGKDFELNSSIAPVITNFKFANNIANGGSTANTNGFGGTPGYVFSNNVTSNPSFIARNASPPDLRIPIGSTADGAGSPNYDPESMLADASAWFLANATADNKDASGVNSFNSTAPACGAYEAA